jgi:hypothetical protein
MKMRLVLAVVLIVSGLAARADVAACGDKFLVIGRSVRYDRTPALRRSAAILLYAGPGTDLARTLTSVPVENTLRKAGYQIASIALTSDLDRALASRTWDVIVIDGTETQTVAGHLTGPSAPGVLPVLHNPAAAVLQQSKARYGVIIKTPARTQSFVDAVDDAVELHRAETTAPKRKS